MKLAGGGVPTPARRVLNELRIYPVTGGDSTLERIAVAVGEGAGSASHGYASAGTRSDVEPRLRWERADASWLLGPRH